MDDYKNQMGTNPSPHQNKTHSLKDALLERGSKHIGGYFSPDVSRQLRQIALDENTSVQALLGEAILLLFESRNVNVPGD